MIHEFNGFFDTNTGRIYANTTDTWEDYATWDSWTSWNNNPVQTMYVPISGFINLGSLQTVNVTTNIQANGTLSYFFITNPTMQVDTGATPSYSIIEVENGDTNIPSLTARLVRIELAVTYDPNKGAQWFDTANFQFNTESYKTLTFGNINSSTLSGTVEGRVFSLGQDVGGIKDVQITSHGSITPYNVDLYVSKNATSSYTYPDIVSKGSGAVTVKFIGIDGEARDSTFDITVTTLPEWYMDIDGNLKER